MEQLSGRDVVSLVVGIASLVLSVYFIKEPLTKMTIIIIVTITIISSYFVIVYKEINQNSAEIRKINERMDIYNRLNKIEASIDTRGERK